MTISKDGTWICSTCQDPECGGPTPQGLGDDGELDFPNAGTAFRVADFYEALNAVKKLNPSIRINIFNKFCKHCGGDDPRCHCWNDE